VSATGGDERAAFLFAGQGEEGPRMVGEDVLRLPEVQRLLAHGSQHAAVDLAQVVRAGGAQLARTELLQPALVAIALGLFHELAARGAAPWAVAGHSLGELSAWAAAGCLAFDDAVRLACVRGAAMAEAARRAPGGMVALHDADDARLEQVLACGRAVDPVLDVAAHNAPGMHVLSGSRAALAAIEARFSVTRLKVAGPWHSRSMHEAERTFARALATVAFSAPCCTVIANRTGAPLTLGDDLRAVLAGQLTRPVRWAETMRSLGAAGVERVVTVGPARALRGLCRANLGPGARIVSASAVHAPVAERVA
jgi:[acyl-carrier-protein] S-malonyltransferase